MKYNSNLIDCGWDIIATLEEITGGVSVLIDRFGFIKQKMIGLYFKGSCCCSLQSKAAALISEPFRELLKFFAENETSLDIGEWDDRVEDGDLGELEQHLQWGRGANVVYH